MTINKYPFTDSDLIRFWNHVHKTDSCWLWIAKKKGESRYGMMGWASKSGKHLTEMSVHRLSWIIHNGPVPHGKHVLHNCPNGDRKDCVNPSHLYIGTSIENGKDRSVKRQAAFGNRNGRYTHPESTPRGSNHPQARLNEQQVIEIRGRRSCGETLLKLATEYGVSLQQVHRIDKRKTWSHL